MIAHKVSSLLYETVHFQTKWGEEGIGEIRILSNGKCGILSPTSVFEIKDIKSVRRVK